MKRLTRSARSYYTSGANNMVSLKESNKAFQDFRLKSAAEVDESAFEGTEITFLGKKIKTPLSIASTAFHRMAHPDGEVATARAANAVLNTPVLLSNWATTSVEDVGQNAPDCLKLFQVYMSKSDKVNADLWSRCRESGFTGICLTTDTQLLGKRDNDVRIRFNLPEHLDLANLSKYNTTGHKSKMSSEKQSALAEYVQ